MVCFFIHSSLFISREFEIIQAMIFNLPYHTAFLLNQIEKIGKKM